MIRFGKMLLLTVLLDSMRVLTTNSSYKQDPVKYLGFKKFEEELEDFNLIQTAFYKTDNLEQFGLRKTDFDRRKTVRIELEEPNKFFINDLSYNYDHLFDKVYTICPYSADWINKKFKSEKRVPVFFPFNENYLPKNFDKKFDIIYTGHIVSNILYRDLLTLKKFNYRIVSNSNNKLVTNKGVSYTEKIGLIAKSKITLVHNLLYPQRQHVFNLWKIKDFKRNKAFKLIPRRFDIWGLIKQNEFLVPQLKSRVFEAAFCKSLILCKKDSFNIIERFFTPNKEFIYYKDNLQKTITKILLDYTSYQTVINNAYKRAVESYTTKSFVYRYLKNIK